MAEHKPRAELVRAAHAAAAALFVGKPSLSADLVRRAKSAAFEAVRRADPTAGLSTHPSAAYSYGIVAVADEGVKEAQDSWARIKRSGVRSPAQLDREIASALHSVGATVRIKIPSVMGKRSVGGRITRVMPNGDLEIRSTQDGYFVVAPSQVELR